MFQLFKEHYDITVPMHLDLTFPSHRDFQVFFVYNKPILKKKSGCLIESQNSFGCKGP